MIKVSIVVVKKGGQTPSENWKKKIRKCISIISNCSPRVLYHSYWPQWSEPRLVGIPEIFSRQKYFSLQSLSAHSDSSEQTTVKVKVNNPRENYFLWKLFGFGRDTKLKRAWHSSAGNCASRPRHLELLRIQTKYYNSHKTWIINLKCNLLELFILGSRQKPLQIFIKFPEWFLVKCLSDISRAATRRARRSRRRPQRTIPATWPGPPWGSPSPPSRASCWSTSSGTRSPTWWSSGSARSN